MMGCVCSICGEMIVRGEDNKLFCPGCRKKRKEADEHNQKSEDGEKI